MKVKTRFAAGLVCLLLILGGAMAWAQTAAGRIVGTVVDSQGAVVPMRRYR